MVQEVEVKTAKFTPAHINSHFDEIAEQFKIYTEDIQPLIINIEELKSEFPSEILNEVRAMYTHLSRAFLTNREEDVVSNIEKIKRHTKRALLDCFKNSCIIIIDQRNRSELTFKSSVAVMAHFSYFDNADLKIIV